MQKHRFLLRLILCHILLKFILLFFFLLFLFCSLLSLNYLQFLFFMQLRLWLNFRFWFLLLFLLFSFINKSLRTLNIIPCNRLRKHHQILFILYLEKFHVLLLFQTFLFVFTVCVSFRFGTIGFVYINIFIRIAVKVYIIMTIGYSIFTTVIVSTIYMHIVTVFVLLLRWE